MEYQLHINCDNAAFDDTPASEVARILRKAADRMEAGLFDFSVYDINGNRVGFSQMED